MTALFVLAGGVQALAPAPAAAMDDSETGKCVSWGIPGMPEIGFNGQEICVIGGSGGEPPTVSNTEPVITIHSPGVAPPDDTPPPCPAFGCLRPRPPRGGVDRDLFGQAPPQERGGSSRRRDLEPALESQDEICSYLKTELPKVRKKLSYLRQELRNQQDTLRLMRLWGEMAPPDDSIWPTTSLNPRDAEVLVGVGLAEMRQKEAGLVNILRGLVHRAKKNECPLDSLDVM